jgi:hypothetical protein
MAKYNVTYSCGHTGSVQIYGKIDGRQAQADHMATRLCPECYAAKKKADKDAQITSQRTQTPQTEAKVPLDLPDLTGTDKQIAWARDIRAQYLQALQARGLKWDAVKANADHPKVRPELDKLLTTDAKWWINHRTASIFGVYPSDATAV